MADEKHTNRPQTGITNTTRDVRASLMLGLLGPAGIEFQEARGQVELASSEQLPCRGLVGAERAAWERIGVKVLDADAGTTSARDPLFCRVELPQGWRRRPTDHPLWTDLVDDRDRTRGRICYKAAFHDRYAHIVMETRFGVRRNFDGNDGELQFLVMDGGRQVHATERVQAYGGREFDLDAAICAHLRASCLRWLEDRGVAVDFQDPTAYWEVDLEACGRFVLVFPEVSAPDGRLSGQSAIDLAGHLGRSVLIGIEPDCARGGREVRVADAFRLIRDGRVPVGAFWLEERADLSAPPVYRRFGVESPDGEWRWFFFSVAVDHGEARERLVAAGILSVDGESSLLRSGALVLTDDPRGFRQDLAELLPE